MLKFLGLLVVVGLAFWLGVQVGQHGPDAAIAKAKQLGTDFFAKTFMAEHKLRVHTNLVNAKERLVQAKSDLLDKNYGKAEAGLEEAVQHLVQAKEAADEDLRKRLDGLLAKVSEVAAHVKALKPGIQAKLDEAVQELDTLLKH